MSREGDDAGPITVDEGVAAPPTRENDPCLVGAPGITTPVVLVAPKVPGVDEPADPAAEEDAGVNWYIVVGEATLVGVLTEADVEDNIAVVPLDRLDTGGRAPTYKDEEEEEEEEEDDEEEEEEVDIASDPGGEENRGSCIIIDDGVDDEVEEEADDADEFDGADEADRRPARAAARETAAAAPDSPPLPPPLRRLPFRP